MPETLFAMLRRWLIALFWAIDLRTAPSFHTAVEAGQYGERVAGRYLRRHGYRIMELNFRTAEGEIDIIAEDEDGLAFVEVRSRREDRGISPYETVDRHKQLRLGKAVSAWLRKKKLRNIRFRGDIVEVILTAGEVPRCRLLKNAHDFSGHFQWW